MGKKKLEILKISISRQKLYLVRYFKTNLHILFIKVRRGQPFFGRGPIPGPHKRGPLAEFRMKYLININRTYRNSNMVTILNNMDVIVFPNYPRTGNSPNWGRGPFLDQ
uniref:Uncharacterized protein n=1 Tax=Cacopsylla melanoneura TaxID=428564 RepID=A0A8D8Q489_9HEMI